ncbi:hypothetical protein [Rummeliibacillus stabekisii]|uniref:Uncharacterized protein n=1 Tax=Rummeliibacillus stabekisii TaxID=241244 RepID=A0A143HC94_9BACL|nr:hypothetical protein [Rummeliibacillus stabekisii]AMW99322.1 hypothetical protein ATY39_07505 [Rummeliibacillus stabekisii]
MENTKELIKELVKVWISNARRCLKALANFFNKIRDNIIEAFKKLRKHYPKPETKKNFHKQQSHQLNFSRPLIKHQVMDRKPKNIIRRIF